MELVRHYLCHLVKCGEPRGRPQPGNILPFFPLGTPCIIQYGDWLEPREASAAQDGTGGAHLSHLLPVVQKGRAPGSPFSDTHKGETIYLRELRQVLRETVCGKHHLQSQPSLIDLGTPFYAILGLITGIRTTAVMC